MAAGKEKRGEKCRSAFFLDLEKTQRELPANGASEICLKTSVQNLDKTASFKAIVSFIMHVLLILSFY